MSPEIATQSVLERALSLARQNFYVFPVGRNKKPLMGGSRGHLDASIDAETIATWWGVDYPDAMIGVHCGRSNLVVLDLDRHNEDADGFASLELGWLGIEPSFEYNTATNEGRHIWYRAPLGIELPPVGKYRNMEGVDRKSGSSYVVVWTNHVPDQIRLAQTPTWLLDIKDRRSTGDAFEGGLDAWLGTLEEGEPSEKVLAAIERIPEDYDHNELIRRQTELVRLGAEGRVGVHAALDILRESWCRPPYNDEDHRYEYDVALDGCIRKFGAQEARITLLPSYMNCMEKLGASSVDLLVGKPQSKNHYFYTIRVLAGLDYLNEDEIASLVWHGPATKDIAHDWSIDYLYAQIGSARLKANSPIENPALALDTDESSQYDLTLLTEQERTELETMVTWLDGYLDWASTKVNVLNEPYHVQNGLTILSTAFGCRVFIPLKARLMGVNLFQIGLGESSTGKSESIALRDQPIREVFMLDPTYDMGANPSPEALHETLIKRNLLPSLFNTDEAAGPLAEFLVKSYQAGALDRLTSYYEGYVAPMLRRGQGGAALNQSAVASFGMAMFGTPAKVLDILTREQFESGFLARFLWTMSDEIVADDSQYEESEATERAEVKEDPTVQAFADTLGRRCEFGAAGIPILCEPTALLRLGQNRKRMAEALATHEQWPIIQPSVRRLGDNIRKIATLLAVADGCDRVGDRHALAGMGLAEGFLANLEQVARRVSASVYERNCDEVMAFVLAQGGGCPSSRVFHKFRAWELKDVMSVLDGLTAQGRIKRLEANGARGERIEVNYQGEVE